MCCALVPPPPSTRPILASGSGNLSLALSWMEGLAALAISGALGVFTCANDYSDVRGEAAVWRGLIGARFTAPPAPSPFAACSTFHSPGVCVTLCPSPPPRARTACSLPLTTSAVHVIVACPPAASFAPHSSPATA